MTCCETQRARPAPCSSSLYCSFETLGSILSFHTVALHSLRFFFLSSHPFVWVSLFYGGADHSSHPRGEQVTRETNSVPEKKVHSLGLNQISETNTRLRVNSFKCDQSGFYSHSASRRLWVCPGREPQLPAGVAELRGSERRCEHRRQFSVQQQRHATEQVGVAPPGGGGGERRRGREEGGGAQRWGWGCKTIIVIKWWQNKKCYRKCYCRRRIIHAPGAHRLHSASTQRSLTWSHFFIPYAYVSHPDTLKCHSIQRQANTPNKPAVSLFSTASHHTPAFFPVRISHLPHFLLMPSRTYLSMFWQGALHRRWEKMLREGPLCGTGMQSVDKVGLRSIPRHKTSDKAENRESTYFFSH